MDKQKGRKRSRNPEEWKQNKKIQSRNKGEEYVSNSGKKVDKKVFIPLESCCRNQCFLKIEVSEQQKIHDNFWKLGSYASGNVFLSTMITNDNSGDDNKKRVKWIYHVTSKNDRLSVCKKYFCNLFSIGMGRIESVQNKIVTNTSLNDNRGKHKNHVLKLTDDVKALIQLHCESLPHSESHYTREDSKLNYFDSPDLTLHELYNLFIEYYASITGDEKIPLDESSYSKHFNHHVNFSFKLPRTDVCNVCAEFEVNKIDEKSYKTHKKKVEDYNNLKKQMLNTKNVMHLEFDFAQNLPLPKLAVNVQFFCRLLWLHVFNVHVHNNGNSYMFYFLEGTLKKGANTVCNLVHHAIQKELEQDHFDKIFLYSDGAGGQNRNYLTVLFLSMIAVKYQLEIQHLYPVRGHSYCQCDRNFGLYGKKKKMKEKIEIVDEYVKLIKSARNPPFIMIDASAKELQDFEQLADINKELKKIKISQAVKINYYGNGQIDVFYSYNENPVTFSVLTNSSFFDSLNIIAPGPAGGVGISKEKIQDVEKLLNYLSPEASAFYNELFKKTIIKQSNKKRSE